MGWFKENKFKIGIIFINLIFIMTVMKVCYRIQQFDYFLIIIVFLASVALYYVFSGILKKASHRMLFSSILIFILSLFIYKKKMEISNYISTNLIDNFNKINDLLYKGAPTEFELFKHYIIVFLPIITIVLLVMYSKGLTEAVLVLNLAIMLLFWYLEYVPEVKSQLFSFIAISVATFAVNNHLKYIKKMHKLGIKTSISFKGVFINIVIYSLMISLVGMALPQNYAGNYSQETMNKWTNPFSPDPTQSIGRAKGGRFGLSSSGYSNTETDLGGPLTLDNRLAFKVKSDKQLYLRGDVKDIYTGKAWIKAEENYQTKSDISDTDTNRFLNNTIARNFDSSMMYITIIPQNITTNTIFVPYYASKVFSDKGKVYFEANGETFINSSKVTKEYTIELYDPDRVAAYINSNYFYRDITVRRDRDDNYLSYPKEISVRTVELVYSIVKGLKTNRQKVEAIHSYLSQAYPYSLDVSEVPEDQEFLDYFLFTEKKGYCTYFATAMTIMCRIAGIPARYVEGFKMPAQSVNGIYDVTNEQAHAWAEVLYQDDPQIWVIKDPSPTPQEERERIEQEQQVEESTAPVSSDTNPIEEEAQEEEKIVEDERDFETDEMARAINYNIVLMLGILSIVLLYIIIRFLLYFYRCKALLNHGSNIPLYHYCLKRLKSAGIKKEDIETDKDFLDRIDDVAFRNMMSELVTRVYEEFYGGMKAGSFNKSNLYKTLEDFIKVKQNTFIYIIKKYLI